MKDLGMRGAGAVTSKRSIRGLLALVLAGLVLTAGGCPAEGDADQHVHTVTSLSPGKHTVTKAIRGTWKAVGATRGCHWTLTAKDGDEISSGKWSLSNREQWVLLGTGNLGMTFWANDACGTWT